jgi:peptide/nickel transport system substrate-binding protein
MRRLLAALLAVAMASCRPAPEAQPLRVLIVDDVLSLDPNRRIDTVTDGVLFNVYEPLVGLDRDLQPRPVLASGWEHPTPETWRFTLRRGIRFHDGTLLDARLVREALLGLREAEGDAAQFLTPVRDIVVVDEHTIDLVTEKPRSLLASLPFLYVTKKNAKGTDPPLVGTGPYRIRSWKAREHIDLVRFPEYREELPAAPGAARFLPVPDDASRLDRVARGEADLALGVPPVLAAGPRVGVEWVEHQGISVFYLGFNLRHAAVRDVRVRRAVHLALDRDEVLGRVLLGRGAVASQPVAPVIFGYNPSLPAPQRDLEAARRLLAEAGHGSGLTLSLIISSGRLDVAQLLTRQLGEAGILLDVKSKDDDVYGAMEQGTADLFFMGWDCSTGEASEFYEFCMHTPGGVHGRGNYGHYSNRRIDEIAQTNATILDQRQRRKLLEEAASLVMEELPVLPLYVRDEIYAVRPGVKFQPRSDSQVRLADVTVEGSR